MPFTKQIDGNHYSKLKMQPLQLTYLIAGGDACFNSVAKYLLRDKNDVNGKPLRPVDLNKAIHFIELGSEQIQGTLRSQQYKKVNDQVALEAIEMFADQSTSEYNSIIQASLYFMWIGQYKDATDKVKMLAVYEGVELTQ